MHYSKFLSNSSYDSTSNLETSSGFQRGQIVGVRLAGTSLTKTATLLGVSRAAGSKVVRAHIHIMERHHQLRIVVENQN